MTTSGNERYGLAVTIAGTMMFVPDATVIRMAGADAMDMALWRSLFGCAATGAGVALFARHLIPTRAQLLQVPTLIFIALHGVSSVLFLAALARTSVANTLLISATAPFLAALLSWVVLGERPDRATGYGIAVVFAGVGIIASGSPGGGALLGDLMAFGAAVAMAAYYVVLRHAATRSLIVPSTLGFVVTALIALPFAPLLPMTAEQIGLTVLSGAVLLAGGSALLIIAPRYLPAAEVSMITLLESVASPLLVWAVLGEYPGDRSVLGGAVIFAALTAHTLWRWRRAG